MSAKLSFKLSTKLSLFIITFFICLLSTQAQTQPAPYDFDGDNKSDLTVYRPSSSFWYIFQSQSQTARSAAFGVSTDRIVPGDYDGDGKDDLAVFRPTDMTWYILQSRDGFRYQQWGVSGDLPFAGDFDGDGITDLVVIRTGPDNLMTWHILRSQAGYTFLTYGEVGDIPVRGDFDNDGKAEVAIWRPSTGYWYYRKSTDNQDVAVLWGLGSLGDMVGAGDYDGDGKTDPAVWRSSTGVWYILQSSNSATVSYQFGGGTYGDVPVPGDYDGDGKYDYAVWRVPTGVWHIQRSQLGYIAQQWGSATLGDKLAPFAFVPTGTVVGTVKSDADVTIEGALIEVTEQGVLKAVTTTSSTGYFFLPGVSTGQYEIRVSYKSTTASTDCSTDAYDDTRLTGIGLLAGGTTTVNVTLARKKICLEDNFNTDVLGALWQKGLIGQGNNNDNNVNVVNQRLEVTIPAASGPPLVFNGIRTVSGNYNLRDAYVSTRIAKVPIENSSQTFQSEARLEVGIDSNNKLWITASDRLILWKETNGDSTELRNVGFSRVTKAFVRIRFKYSDDPVHPKRGFLFMETSQTGGEGTWVSENYHGEGILFEDFDLAAVRVSLSGGSWGATAATKAAFDDFRFGKYNALVARAGDDQTVAHTNPGVNLQGNYACEGCTNISNVTYKWTLASKPVGAPDPTINTPTGASTSLNGINFPGSYNFQFTVRATYDFNGQSYTSSSTDSVRIYIAEAPVARIASPDSVMEDEPIVFDGSLSSGAYEYEWNFGDGRKAELARSTHLYMTPTAPLFRTITLKVTNEAGIPATVTKEVQITPLPVPTTTVTLPTCVPATANQTLVDAISLASGRTDIILRAGCDYGSISLPNKSGSDYIVLKSNGNLPPKGTRISASDSNLANMPIISTASSASAMTTQASAHHYRFVGVLFRRQENYTGEIFNLVYLDDPTVTGTWQNLSTMPHHFVFDRCIFSNLALRPGVPNPPTDVAMRRGLVLNIGSASVINSYFREIKQVQYESQALASWAGAGPHAIINNYLEGATENIMYGGEHMRVEYLTPSDITIRGNYIFKPLEWENVSGINTKNLLELKHVRNIVIDGNVLRNSFPQGDQGGIALTLTVRNQSGFNPWSTVQNVQITNNKIDNVGRGFGILGLDDTPGHASIPARNFIIRNNLWERVGEVAATNGSWGSLNRPPFKVWLNHNTVFHTGNMMRGDGVPTITNDSDFHFDNNILKHNDYGFKGEGIVQANGLDYLNTFVPGWRMRRNVIAFGPVEWGDSGGTYPNDLLNENRYIQDSESYATFYSQFVNYAQGNFHLTIGSLGYQWATDYLGDFRNDVGCNIDQLGSATAGSEAGNWPLP